MKSSYLTKSRHVEFIFLLRVVGRGFYVEGDTFFSLFFFLINKEKLNQI